MSIRIVCYKCKFYIHNEHRCDICQLVAYCSKECQTNDWEQHQVNCEYHLEDSIKELDDHLDNVERNKSFQYIMGAFAHYLLMTEKTCIFCDIILSDDEYGCNISLYSNSNPKIQEMLISQRHNIILRLEHGIEQSHILGIHPNRSQKHYNSLKKILNFETLTLPVKLNIYANNICAVNIGDNKLVFIKT